MGFGTQWPFEMTSQNDPSNDPPKWLVNDREMNPKMTISNDPKKVQKSSSCLLALTKLFANKHHGEHNHHEAKIRIFIAWKIRPHSRQWCVECIPFDNRHQPWQSPSKSERYSSLTISIKLGQSLLWCVDWLQMKIMHSPVGRAMAGFLDLHRAW